jgi:hypothetical protein
MQTKFFSMVTVLFVALFCYDLHVQAQTDALTFSFSAPQKVLTGATSTAGHVSTQTASDINGDGNTDIIVIGPERDILFGDGKGGFTLKKSNIPSGNATAIESSVLPWTLVDANRDGHPDSIFFYGGTYVYDPESGCQNYDPSVDNGQIYVSLNDGHGNFTLNQAATIQIYPETYVSVAVGDFNNDGLKDIAVLTSDNQECAPVYSDNLYILLNNGDGTFTSQGPPSENPAYPTVYPISIYSASNASPPILVAGDFNGDGKLDLAFLGQANTAPSNTYVPIQVLYGNGDGSFKAGPVYKVDVSANSKLSYVDSLLAGDLNGDGKTDLVIHAVPKDASAPTAIVTLLAMQSGGFYWNSELSVPNNQIVGLIGLMDLNQDGRPDLAYYSLDTSTKITSLRAYPGIGSGKFGPSSLIRNLGSEWESDVLAPLKQGEALDIFYGLSYPPNRNVYLYEMLNQSK